MEIIGVIFMFVLTIAIAIPLGRYMGVIFSNQSHFSDKIFNPIEKTIYQLSGINPDLEMSWKQHLKAMLTVNLVWFVVSMLVLTNMAWLPLNPDQNPSMSADLAFNTAISFIANTNLQHYSGESGLSYLGQMVLMLWQFLSAGTGISMAILLFTSMREKTTNLLGNFYVNLVKSTIRVLLPISIIIATLLVFNGSPMTFLGKDTTANLQGESQSVSRGLVAAFTAIKHLGTNGGGFFGANSAHPFENPNYLTNIVEMVAQMIIPIALIFAMGFMINRKKLSWMVFGVMTFGFLILTIPTMMVEINGNPAIERLGVSQESVSMEGKEVRFGPAASAYWSIATTVISTGSVNSMHDSFTPLGGMNQMLAMMVNAFYGGCGVGMLNFYIFIILAVFISGLMVGRTPEFLGKKVEGKEMKIAMIIALLHPFLILIGTAISSYLVTANQAEFGAWLNNPGFHGFSEMLYEYTSSSANNGSGFEGLGDNTPFWNISTGLIILIGRFLPIIGPIAIAGILADKKYIPEGNGTLKTDTFTFGIVVFAVILIITSLSFFPALSLGPIAEYFSLK